jgi:glycosyltransferase involved in cell wall biosynthesis
MSIPLLSIIIPTYNRSALVMQALESVRSQPFVNFEVIVVDDGSTDDTPATLAREMADPRWSGKLHVYRQSNAGPGAARNLALQFTGGEYCVFLDSDDLLFPWSLSVIAQAIHTGGRPSVIIGREVQFSTLQQHAAVMNEPLQTSSWADLYTLARLGPTGTLVARAELIRSVGGFVTDRYVGEDADLMLRLGTVPNLVRIEAPGLYGYRKHDGKFSREDRFWAEGVVARIRRYNAGIYPGGESRRGDVRKMVSYNAAWATLHCMKSRSFRAGGELYVKTFLWQLRGGEIDYLLKTPLRFLLCLIGLWPLHAADRAGKL